eukprot:TRINITY_DN36753_c0_g1_i1.p1 TRINITY_DN36753_c0_g1~~TRINITY_DN36753_c0_g1_i1.p1  ORF type:complete len:575 (+),score=227.64 TRINITY_DN36753_c0_g1_i1:93-1727(+)
MAMRGVGVPVQQSSGPDRTPLVVGVAAVACVAIWYGAYSLGTNQASEGLVRSAGLKQRTEFLRTQLAECQQKTTSSERLTSSLKGDALFLWQWSKELEEDNERLVKMNEDLEKRSIECVENSESQKQSWSEEDRSNAGTLSKLDRRNKDLVQHSMRLHNTRGMKMILLESTLRKLGEENKRLREKLELPSVTQGGEYADSLVTKWKGNVSRIPAKPNRTEFSQLLRKPNLDWTFSEADHAERIAFPRRTPDGHYRKPTWNGREGTQKLVHGVHVNSRYVSSLGVAEQFRTLYEYALCAMGNNMTKMMYPAHFRHRDARPGWKETANRHLSLADFVETPMVNFCDDCRPQHKTPEFHLLCQGYSSRHQYGSFMFWRTRSRIAFKSRLMEAADKWISAMEIDDKDGAVAVRLARDNCGVKSPQLSYLRLLKGRVREVFTDSSAQCSPDIHDAVSAVGRIAKTARAGVVYLSGLDKKDFQAFENGLRGLRVLRREPSGASAENTVIDILIAAQMGHLIANRYDVVSTLMVEQHLLNHRLKVKNITVW